jgi:hypothetical protein
MIDLLLKLSSSHKKEYSMTLDAYDKRLKEVLAEIGQLGGTFEEISQARIENPDDTVASVNKLRISGFKGYFLAQEGLALINLIGITLVNSPERQKEFEYIAKIEPLLQNASKSMEMYKTLTAKEIIERALGGSSAQ